MNDELQKELAGILTMLRESAQVVGSTAQQEIPLLVQEYLRWGLASNLIIASVCVGLIVAIVRVYKAWRDDLDTVDGGLLTILSAVSVVVLILICATHLLTAAKVLLAPRVYLLDTVLKAIQ